MFLKKWFGPAFPSHNPSGDALQKRVVTGKKSSTGTSYFRIEIDDFCADRDALNLFLLALEDLQRNTKTQLYDPNSFENLWSWFGLAAAHGGIPIPYNDVQHQDMYDVLKASGRGWQRRYWNMLKKQVDEGDNAPVPDGTGYCQHGSVLFPTWHRVYSMAAEQSFQAKMNEIAGTYTNDKEREKMKLIADAFRLPYWSPFRARYIRRDGSIASGTSLIFSVTKVRVKRPNANDYVVINNPLYAYYWPTKVELTAAFGTSFGEVDDVFELLLRKLGTENRTIRNGSKQNKWSNNVEMQERFMQGLTREDKDKPPPKFDPPSEYDRRVFSEAGLRAKLYACLTARIHTDAGDIALPYVQFATAAYERAKQYAGKFVEQPASAEPRSVEAWHDSCHYNIAGDHGTMNPNSFSGFEPMFHPLHAFIDFVFALYQAVHPNENRSDITPQNPNAWWNARSQQRVPDGIKVAQTSHTYTAKQGTREVSDTPLTPFRIDRAGMQDGVELGSSDDQMNHPWWTSLDVQDIDRLGYSYAAIPIGDAQAKRKAANEYINLHFAWFQPSTASWEENPDSINYKKGKESFRADVPTHWENHPVFEKWPPDIDEAAPGSDEKLKFGVRSLVDLYDPGQNAPAPSPIDDTIPLDESEAAKEEEKEEKDSESSTINTLNVVNTMAIPNATVTSKRMMSSTHRAGTSVDSALQTTVKDTAKPPSAAAPAPNERTRSTANTFEPQIKTNIPSNLIRDGSIRNWSFQYKVQRRALNTSFSTFVFIGDFPSDQKAWPTARNLVLANNVLTTHDEDMVAPYTGEGDDPCFSGPNAGSSSCSRCNQQKQDETTTMDYTTLTPMLIDFIETGRSASSLVTAEEATLTSLEPVEVIPFLKRHLHWRIVRSDGVEIHRNDVADFKAWVHDEVMVLPTRMDELPHYYGHEIRHEITDGRPGGLDENTWPISVD